MTDTYTRVIVPDSPVAGQFFISNSLLFTVKQLQGVLRREGEEWVEWHIQYWPNRPLLRLQDPEYYPALYFSVTDSYTCDRPIMHRLWFDDAIYTPGYGFLEVYRAGLQSSIIEVDRSLSRQPLCDALADGAWQHWQRFSLDL